MFEKWRQLQASQMPGTLFNKLFPIRWCNSSQVLVFAVICWCTPFVHFIHLLPWKTCYWCWLPVAIPCDNESDCQIEFWQTRQELNCWTAWSDRVVLKGNEFIHVGTKISTQIDVSGWDIYGKFVQAILRHIQDRKTLLDILLKLDEISSKQITINF